MFSSFSGSFKFGRRRVAAATPAALVLGLDANTYSGSGAWLDSTANDNDATIVQSPTYSSLQAGYFTFDGGTASPPGSVDSFSVADSASLHPSSGISIIMWIYISVIPNADPNLLFTKRTTTGDGLVGFYNQTLYRFRIGTSGTGTGNSLDWTTSPTVGAWQQIVVTVGAAGGKIYKDGILVRNDTNYVGNFANISTTESLLIGDCKPLSSGVNGFRGRMSIFQVYNGVLTADEVVTEFNKYRARYGLEAIGVAATDQQLYLIPGAYSGSGTSWTDNSPNAYTTTLVGSPTFNTTYFNFPNTSARYIDTNQSISSESFSVGIWFRTSATGIKMTLCKETTGGWPWNYRIWFNGGQIVGDIANGAGSSESITSPLTTYNNGAWHLVMFTRDSSNLRLYVNGVEVANSAASLATVSNSQEVWIGRSAFAGAYQWVGDLGEAFIYSRVLTASEILANYNATKPAYGL